MVAESQFHVLAVDDSIIDRKLVEMLLKKSSYKVTTVDSARKALDFLGLNEYDSSTPSSPPTTTNNSHDVEVNLVITDYRMPGMTGYDLLKKMKESSLLKNIPVVIMSSENVPARITRCLEEGAEEFFLKPMKLSDVTRLKFHMMKSVNRKVDPTGEFELKNLEIQSQPQLDEQQQLKKRKAAEENELSSNRTPPRYDGVTVV